MRGVREAIDRVRGSDPDERGQSISVFVIVVLVALFLTVGLVIDGGQKITATARAESAAAGAARAAGNAAATGAVVGQPDVGAARTAAQAYLDSSPGVTGAVSMVDGVIVVTTRSSAPTVFLSAIGVGSLSGTGRAEASIVSGTGG